MKVFFFTLQLLISLQLVHAQSSAQVFDLLPGERYLISVKVDHPEDLKTNSVLIGSTTFHDGDGGPLKYNPSNGRMEGIFTIPKSVSHSFAATHSTVEISLEDAAYNRSHWRAHNEFLARPALDYTAPIWRMGRAIRMDETTLQIDVLLEEQNSVEGRFSFLYFHTMNYRAVDLGMNCIPYEHEPNMKWCSLRVTLPARIPFKVSPYGTLKFRDEAGNTLVAKVSNEMIPATSALPRLFLDWPYAGQTSQQSAGSIGGAGAEAKPTFKVFDVAVTEYNTQTDWIRVTFKVSGGFSERVYQSAKINWRDMKAFSKCGKKDSKGIAECEMQVFLPKVINESEIAFQFDIEGDVEDTQYHSLIYTQDDLEVLKRIPLDTTPPEVLDVSVSLIKSR